MLEALGKGLLIGFMFGIPVGAVGALTIQRSLKEGFAAGVITGLGSSLADCVYAFVGMFGLSLITDFLTAWQREIRFGGCLVILVLDWRMGRKSEALEMTATSASPSRRSGFLSAFLIGITNPAAILTFLFAFSYFGLGAVTSGAEAGLVVIGIGCGTLTWWCVLAALASGLRKQMNEEKYWLVNQVLAALLLILGVVIGISALY